MSADRPADAAVVLVIDDIRAFVFPALYARTEHEALALLFASPRPIEIYDEVWFDHDLGDGQDIFAIVGELERRAFAGEPLPLRGAVVHSANPVGAQRLMAALERLVPTRRVDAKPLLGDLRAGQQRGDGSR